MRFFIALIVLFTIQLNAEAPESADFSSSASPVRNWAKQQDMFVKPARDEAKVKALIRDLLGEDRPAAGATTEENSAGAQSVD